LPWRSDPTPYGIWISEIMLQQTQVRTVLPYYERFMKRFPDLCTLASAPQEQVIALWSGLGYYSRARNLHSAAKIVIQEFAGRFPNALQDLLTLPGVGRYTAGAICSIAYNQPHSIVDGNIRRLITRIHGIEHDATERLFWRVAGEWLPEDCPSDFNQAIMELGALICTKPAPQCHLCPVDELCDAHARGIQDKIPRRRSRRASESVKAAVLVVSHLDKILLVRRRKIDFIPGEWGLPSRVVPAGGIPHKVARGMARGILNRTVILGARPPIRHAITHRRILCHVFDAELRDGSVGSKNLADMFWCSHPEVQAVLTSSLYKKALRASGFVI
jgi:A/G-specific adenine glycosylase